MRQAILSAILVLVGPATAARGAPLGVAEASAMQIVGHGDLNGAGRGG